MRCWWGRDKKRESIMSNISYSHQHIDQADIAAVTRALRSDWLTQGPMVKEFEEALCRYTSARYAVAVSSGTAALHIACLAAGFEKGQEVVVPANTFAASANAVVYAGAKPVFTDIDQSTGNMDLKVIGKSFGPKTRGIIAVDFAGIPCDWQQLSSMASKRKLVVIDDASHALGASYKAEGHWHKVGCSQHTDMTTLSFHPLKSITTGEGGAVLTNRQDLYEKLLLLRNHGIDKDSKGLVKLMVSLGFNYRIADIQCALGCNQIKKLDRLIKERLEINNFYRKSFAGNRYFDMLSWDKTVNSSHHLFPILLKNAVHRDSLIEQLRARGLGVQVHYMPVYWHPFYRQRGYKRCYAPVSEEFFRREISIPIYAGLSKKDQRFVVKVIMNACNSIIGKGVL